MFNTKEHRKTRMRTLILPLIFITFFPLSGNPSINGEGWYRFCKIYKTYLTLHFQKFCFVCHQKRVETKRKRKIKP